MTETTNPDNRGMYEVRRVVCEACVVLDAEVENDHEHGKKPRGVRYSLLKTGGPRG